MRTCTVCGLFRDKPASDALNIPIAGCRPERKSTVLNVALINDYLA
jgi:hypothetical protein